jgi:hypothetical protein
MHAARPPASAFRNKTRAEVLKYFSSYCVNDFARSGSTATDTVILDAGALQQDTFPHTMLEPLRALGLPVELKNGVVFLTNEHTACSDGDVLTPEQCKVLKLFGHELAEFKLTLLAAWSNSKFELMSAGESAAPAAGAAASRGPASKSRKASASFASAEEDDDDDDDEEEEEEDDDAEGEEFEDMSDDDAPKKGKKGAKGAKGGAPTAAKARAKAAAPHAAAAAPAPTPSKGKKAAAAAAAAPAPASAKKRGTR